MDIVQQPLLLIFHVLGRVSLLNFDTKRPLARKNRIETQKNYLATSESSSVRSIFFTGTGSQNKKRITSLTRHCCFSTSYIFQSKSIIL